MKKMILAAFVLTIVTTAPTYAQHAAVQTAPPVPGVEAQAQAQTKEETKTKVETNALPAAIQQTLAADQYKEWTLVSAWQITGNTEYYVLEMQKGDERKTLKLNKEGKEA